MKNIDIIRNRDGSIDIRVIAKHGPSDVHTISIPRDEWTALKRQVASYHDELHRTPVAARKVKGSFMTELGIETLDSDLINLARKPIWGDTEIVTGSGRMELDPLPTCSSCGGEENEENLKRL